MAKITGLTAWATPIATDVLPIVDVTASTTKKITYADIVGKIPVGTAAAPSVAFTGDANTGFYWIGADNIGLTLNGAKVVDFAAGQIGFPDGTVATPGIGFTGDTDSGIYRIGANNIGIAVNGAKVLDIGTLGINGVLYLNDSANADMTQGITINQGAVATHVMAFKNSQVTHGVTTLAETDTYAYMKILSVNAGGVDIVGITEGSTGIRIYGIETNVDGTRSTAGIGAITINGAKTSGTGVASLGADKNILVVRDNGTTRFILDSDGDSHQDVGTAWTQFDEHDDVALLNQLNAHVSRQGDVLREEVGVWLSTNREPLERLKLVSFNADGHHFVNMSRLTMLLVGAVRQLGQKLTMAEQDIGLLRERLALAGG